MAIFFSGCPVLFCSACNIFPLIGRPPLLSHNDDNFDPGSYDDASPTVVAAVSNCNPYPTLLNPEPETLNRGPGLR